MRKITTIVLAFVFTMLLSTAVFAAEIKIESAEQVSSGKVKVVCALTGGESTQVITVMAYEKDASGEELSNSYYEKLIHIDQFEADVTDGKVKFEFDPASWTSQNKTYIVKVGGLCITTADTMTIINNNGTLEFIFGDADADGTVTENDAALILQKTLTSTSELPIQQETDCWFVYIDADEDNNITSNDAALVLKKATTSSFELPAEKKNK
ncbi:MAG: hypothetical protein IJ583_04075 [Firmicutes bacterium]|nr:hypothetical protein [Bacillota bacterium]